MLVGIHKNKGFCDHWIKYCESNDIPYKIVDCYRSDIIQQLADCDVFLWHFHQNFPKDILFAKQLLYSAQITGKKVFPDFNTIWHFDDKVGQKYLLEAINAPLVTSFVFYSKKEAIQWAKETSYPKVFKLRGGAGSQNVRLVRTYSAAKKLIKKAFGHGFPAYNALGSLKERYRKYRLGKTNFQDLIEGLIRCIYPPHFAKQMGREKGYIYFQEFIPNNEFDIRIIVIGDKSFAIKRMVRKGDFRASGSGLILYLRELFDESTIRLSFQIAEKLKAQCIAFDYVYKNGNALIVEISYGFSPEGYEDCPGYWNKDLKWHEGKFNPYGWIIENLIN